MAARGANLGSTHRTYRERPSPNRRQVPRTAAAPDQYVGPGHLPLRGPLPARGAQTRNPQGQVVSKDWRAPRGSRHRAGGRNRSSARTQAPPRRLLFCQSPLPLHRKPAGSQTALRHGPRSSHPTGQHSPRNLLALRRRPAAHDPARQPAGAGNAPFARHAGIRTQARRRLPEGTRIFHLRPRRHWL